MLQRPVQIESTAERVLLADDDTVEPVLAEWVARSVELLRARGVGGVRDALPLLTMAMHAVVRKMRAIQSSLCVAAHIWIMGGTG